jgi:hypothetical protein
MPVLTGQPAGKPMCSAMTMDTIEPSSLYGKTMPHGVSKYPNQPWLEMRGYSLHELEELIKLILAGGQSSNQSDSCSIPNVSDFDNFAVQTQSLVNCMSATATAASARFAPEPTVPTRELACIRLPLSIQRFYMCF